ncbi:Mitochondrial inner membrane protease atp23 [Agyrium rufum]|nr:Mitochondrial inner membrane protease atp23 [Agyrium rufum]
MASIEPLEPLESKRAPLITGYTPGDDTWTRWRNLASILTGQMNDAGIEAYREEASKRNEAADIARCEKQRDYLLQYSPVVLFMREKINQLGGDIHKGNVRCRRCDTKQAGGFDPNFGIRICANQMRNQGHLEDTLAHGTWAVPTALRSFVALPD